MNTNIQGRFEICISVPLRRKTFRTISVQLDFRYEITQIMKQLKLKALLRRRITQMLLCNIFGYLKNSRFFFRHSRRVSYRVTSKRENHEIFLPPLQ